MDFFIQSYSIEKELREKKTELKIFRKDIFLFIMV